MAKADAPKERSTSDQNRVSPPSKNDELVKRESSMQYKRSIEKINSAQDRDIERALRHC
jgi:hypothetical protein